MKRISTGGVKPKLLNEYGAKTKKPEVERFVWIEKCFNNMLRVSRKFLCTKPTQCVTKKLVMKGSRLPKDGLRNL